MINADKSQAKTLRVVSQDEFAGALATFQATYPEWRDVLFEAIAEHTACRESHEFAADEIENDRPTSFPAYGPCPSPAITPEQYAAATAAGDALAASTDS